MQKQTYEHIESRCGVLVTTIYPPRSLCILLIAPPVCLARSLLILPRCGSVHGVLVDLILPVTLHKRELLCTTKRENRELRAENAKAEKNNVY